MSRPHIPVEPPASPDDDPTGVRALLSGLPEPAPMPGYLVERIHASLNAAQSQRAASFSSDRVTPLVATGRRRPGRVLFAIAGAAAVVLVAVVGTGLFKSNQTGGSTTTAASIASGDQRARAAVPTAASDKAAPEAATVPAVIQIRTSETRYTRADFATQARSLGAAVLSAAQPTASGSLSSSPRDTQAGLTECLTGLGVVGARIVHADLAFYEGVPALIIVATTSDVPMAYAVGRDCTQANPDLLHQATPLP
ncbi:MAG: hypothetical protein ABI899_07585 [Actinomycetota bacterium]